MRKNNLANFILAIRKNKHIFSWSLIILTIAAFIFFNGIGLVSSPVNFDELEHLHAAWLWSQGLQPYVDFFEHHQKLLWLFLKPIVNYFDNNLFAAIVAGRILIFAIVNLLLLVSFFFYARLFNRRVAWLATGLWLLFIIIEPGVLQIRSDMLMLLLLVSGSLILYRLNDLGSSKKKRYSQAIIGGLLLGVAILVTPKAIFWLAAFFVGWVVTSIIESRQQFYFILPLMLISGLVVCSTIIFNLFYESWFYDLDKYYNAIWLANKQCPAVWNTRHNLLMALLVIIHWGVVTPIIFVLSGVILSLSKVIQNVRKSSGHIMIWLLAIAGVVLMLMAKTGNLYNLYPLLWVFIAFTSLALEKIFNSESISAFLNERILLICLIILFGFGTNISSLTLSYSLQPLQTVLALAKPGDTYITERGGGGGGGYSPVFMFDADPLYFMSSVDPDPNRKDLFEVVDTKKPKFVFSSSMNKKTNQQLLTDYFEMSSNQKEYLSPYFQFFILK